MTLPTTIVSKPTINTAHHKIHEGNHFMVHRIITGINVASPKRFLIIPPPLATIASDTIEIHLLFEVKTVNIGFTLELFENSVATGVTALIPINNNRRSITTALAEVYENLAVLTSIGTPIFEERVGITTSGGIGGESHRDDHELILKPGFKYILGITPLANGLNGNMELNWYDNRPSTPIPTSP